MREQMALIVNAVRDSQSLRRLALEESGQVLRQLELLLNRQEFAHLDQSRLVALQVALLVLLLVHGSLSNSSLRNNRCVLRSRLQATFCTLQQGDLNEYCTDLDDVESSTSLHANVNALIHRQVLVCLLKHKDDDELELLQAL